jgi:DNA polymerase III subunit alpha
VRKRPGVPEYPLREKLAFEKEALGFYMSGHPLDRFINQIRDFCNCSTARLRECKEGDEVRIAGIVAARRELITKKGDRMAYVTVEDLEGTLEIAIFPKTFAKFGAALETDEPILVRGRADINEESVKLIAEEIMPLGEVAQKLAQKALIVIEAQWLDEPALARIKELLSAYRGAVPTFLHLRVPGKTETVIALPEQYRIAPGAGVGAELKKYFGHEVLSYR